MKLLTTTATWNLFYIVAQTFLPKFDGNAVYSVEIGESLCLLLVRIWFRTFEAMKGGGGMWQD